MIENLPINVTDLIVIAVIVVSGIFAFMRGLVHELLAVGSWVGAGVATLYGFPLAQPYARQYVTVQLVADVGAGAVIFIVVLVALTILTRLLSRRVRESSLGPLDRTLGLVFGFLRGAVLISIAWLLFSWVLPQEDWPPYIIEAKTKPLIEQSAEILQSLVPDEIQNNGSTAIKSAKDVAGKAQSLQKLVVPLPDSDSSTSNIGGGEPAYNKKMREDIQRAIEAVSQDNTQSTESK